MLKQAQADIESSPQTTSIPLLTKRAALAQSHVSLKKKADQLIQSLQEKLDKQTFTKKALQQVRQQAKQTAEDAYQEAILKADEDYRTALHDNRAARRALKQQIKDVELKYSKKEEAYNTAQGTINAKLAGNTQVPPQNTHTHNQTHNNRRWGE